MVDRVQFADDTVNLLHELVVIDAIQLQEVHAGVDPAVNFITLTLGKFGHFDVDVTLVLLATGSSDPTHAFQTFKQWG